MFKVFVYGTLKRGGHFNRVYGLDDIAKSIEKAELRKHTLWIGMFPYVKSGSDDDVVYGEVHEYPDKVMDTIDAIEGHPHLYKRRETPVWVNGKRIVAWVYFLERQGVGKQIKSGSYDV